MSYLSGTVHPPRTAATRHRDAVLHDRLRRPVRHHSAGLGDTAPVTEKPNMLLWEGTSEDRAIRFLAPVAVYPPGNPTHGRSRTTTSPTSSAKKPPAPSSATSPRPPSAADPATLVTANVPAASTGRSAARPRPHRCVCFGLQPELTLRIAVIELDPAPLLVWLRDIRRPDGSTSKTAPSTPCSQASNSATPDVHRWPPRRPDADRADKDSSLDACRPPRALDRRCPGNAPKSADHSRPGTSGPMKRVAGRSPEPVLAEAKAPSGRSAPAWAGHTGVGRAIAERRHT